MTGEDIEKIRREEPRAFDAMVGRALGVKPKLIPIVTDNGGESAMAVAGRGSPWPTKLALEFWLNDQQAKGLMEGAAIGEWEEFPEYATDPAADYATLKLVRETWPFSRRNAFAYELAMLWNVRVTLPYGHSEAWPNKAMRYECGDYSQAALTVVLSESPKARDAGGCEEE